MMGGPPSRSGPGSPTPAVRSAALVFLLVAGGAAALGEIGHATVDCPALLAGDALARSPVHHVFFLIKENHAFENYFGGRPGVLGYPPSGNFPVTFGSTVSVAPFVLNSTSTPDLPHDIASGRADIDGGRLDGFVAQAASVGASAPADAVGYYPSTAIPGYFAYAGHYALADRFFAGVLGPTLPNRVFDLAATAGNWTSNVVPPPDVFRFPTIFDQLESRGVSFAYDYAGSPSHMPALELPSITDDRCQLARVSPVTQLPSQLAQGASAPAVTFLDPSNDPLVSEHPASNVTFGSEWSSTVVNTILRSPVANSSVIFLYFDEGGGFWDPVLPPMFGPSGDGFRVPLLVLSPWTPSGTLVDTPLDPAALLRFVDDNWGLPPLNGRVAGAPNLAGFFDFAGTRTPPLLLPTSVPLGAGSNGTVADAAEPRAHPVLAEPAPEKPASLYLARWALSGSCLLD